MQIFVKTLSGRTIALDVCQSDSVASLKERIAAREGIESCDQRLVFGGCDMEEEIELAMYGIARESTLYLTSSLDGGKKKRKKKVYTTAKKIAHKKKKVKLAILQCYKVDDDGKITRMRRECPGHDCGAGTFMAQHADRQYCGRCHSTFVQKHDE